MARRAIWLAGLLLPVVLATGGSAFAEDDEDHDLARDLYERGEVRPLSKILKIAGAQRPGDVVAVDLVHRGDRWIYVLQIVSMDGERTMMNIDAANAEVVGDRDP